MALPPYQPRIVFLSGPSAYHDEVRSVLGVGVNTLPDTDIDAQSVLPVAEGLVVARVTNYASLTGDDANYLYGATILMIASRLAPSMNSRIKASEGDSDYKYTVQSVDWHARAERLEDEAYGILDLISTQVVVELPLVGIAGPTTYRQQQMAAQGESDFITPDAGDISLYPTNQE